MTLTKSRSYEKGETKMKIVRFIRNDSLFNICYNVDDIAGFENEIADILIAKGFAAAKALPPSSCPVITIGKLRSDLFHQLLEVARLA